MFTRRLMRKIFQKKITAMVPIRTITRKEAIEGLELREHATSKEDLEYAEEHSKHSTILQMYELKPAFAFSYIAPSATIVGEVFMNKYASVWNNVVIRGEINSVHISSYSSIGDNTVIQTVASLPTGLDASVHIGTNVVIHSDCTLSSCFIGSRVVIGAKSVICEGARLEDGCMIAPGSVVPPGRLIPAGQLWSGNPAQYVKDLDVGEIFTNYSLSYTHSTMASHVRGKLFLSINAKSINV